METLLDFKIKKNWKQALLFYVFFVVIVMIVGAIYGTIFFRADSIEGSLQLAAEDVVLPSIVVLIMLGISGNLLMQKKLTKQPLPILLALASGGMAAFGGAILGMIPAAYISTLAPSEDA